MRTEKTWIKNRSSVGKTAARLVPVFVRVVLDFLNLNTGLVLVKIAKH